MRKICLKTYDKCSECDAFYVYYNYYEQCFKAKCEIDTKGRNPLQLTVCPFDRERLK